MGGWGEQVLSAGSRAQEGRRIKSKEKTWEQQCQDEQGLG